MKPLKLFTVSTKTRQGHTLQFFFNPETDLVVIDVIHKSDRGGNEILRQHIDYGKLLSHCKNEKIGGTI